LFHLFFAGCEDDEKYRQWYYNFHAVSIK